MILLGIDPGSKIVGFGVLDYNKNGYFYIASGCIKTPSNSNIYDRIAVITEQLNNIIAKYKPSEIAIEKIFVNINPSSTLTLGEARGAIISCIIANNIPIFEYTALQVKKAVVGNGKASKVQVQYMVKHLLSLSGIPKPDAADALAVAILHATSKKLDI